MQRFFEMFAGFWGDIIDVFSNVTFTINKVNVNLAGLLFAPLVVGLAITIFWRGSKT